MAIATDEWSVVPVGGRAALTRWEAAWRGVLAQATTQHLFLQPEWVQPWLDRLGADHRPCCLFLGQAGQARAVALFVAKRWGRRGPVVLRPPGLGVSDYLDLLLPTDRTDAERATGRILDWLLAARGWDLLDLPNLPDESPTADLLSSAAVRRGLRLVRLATYQRPYLSLEGNWTAYLATRPSKLRYNLRARRRQLERLGTIRLASSADPDDIAKQLPRAMELHARRWSGQHTSTIFSSCPAARVFYVEAVVRLAERGWAELATLELDGRLLAFSLCFVHDHTFYYYLPAFDPDYARYGPSTALLAYLIEASFERGLSELDFMLGEEPYKEQWASGARGTSRLLIAAPGPTGLAALSAMHLYLTARQRARGSALLRRVRRHGLTGLWDRMNTA